MTSKRLIETKQTHNAKKTRYKATSMIKNLEKDIKIISANPNFDIDDHLRTEEAYLESKLAHLLKVVAKNQKADMKATLATHGERLGGIWTAINKEKKPRDLIRRLKIPESTPPQYERKSPRMAELARNYHDNLQRKEIRTQSPADRAADIERALDAIPAPQKLENPDGSAMSRTATEAQVREAIRLSKNSTATGMDGCPYELWKTKHTDLMRRPTLRLGGCAQSKS